MEQDRTINNQNNKQEIKVMIENPLASLMETKWWKYNSPESRYDYTMASCELSRF